MTRCVSPSLNFFTPHTSYLFSTVLLQVEYHQVSMNELAPMDDPHRIIPPNSSLLAIHACGSATDDCLDVATRLRLPIAVMPCCYRKLPQSSPPVFMDVLGRGASIDVDRTMRLHMAKFAVSWSAIPICITGSFSPSFCS